MKRAFARNRKRLYGSVLAAAIGALALPAIADPITVYKNLDILSDKNSLADPVASVPENTVLERLGTEGSWVKVRTPDGKVGYLTSDDLLPPIDPNKIGGGGSVSAAAASNAGRGFDNDVEAFARQHNLNHNGINAMLATGKSVSRKDVRDFAKAGNVGSKSHSK